MNAPSNGELIRDAGAFSSECRPPTPVDFELFAVAKLTIGPDEQVDYFAIGDDTLEVGITSTPYCGGSVPPPGYVLLATVPVQVMSVAVESREVGECAGPPEP